MSATITPPAASTTPAATSAMTQLTAQLDAYYTQRVFEYLTKTIVGLLGVAPHAVAITVGSDTIGIAAQSKQGTNAATSGAKVDAINDMKQWAADRCNEITQQWGPMDAAAMAQKAQAQAAKATAA